MKATSNAPSGLGRAMRVRMVVNTDCLRTAPTSLNSRPTKESRTASQRQTCGASSDTVAFIRK